MSPFLRHPFEALGVVAGVVGLLAAAVTLNGGFAIVGMLLAILGLGGILLWELETLSRRQLLAFASTLIVLCVAFLITIFTV